MSLDPTQVPDAPAETTAGLLEALAFWERSLLRGGGAEGQIGLGAVPSAVPGAIPTPAALVASVTEYLNLATPAVLPESVDERRRWLSGLGDIYLALGATRRLAADPAAARPWAGVLAEALAGIAVGRLALVGHAGGMWLFGRLAENNLRGFPHSEPWQTVLASAPTGEFDVADQAKVVCYWSLGELSTKNAEFVRESVAKDPGWRDAYREHLRGQFKEVRFLDMDPRLLLHPVLKLPLPHLGQSLEISRSANGFLIRWADQTTVVDSAGELRIGGDSTTGPLSAPVKALEPHLLQTAFQAVSAAAELAQANDASDETTLSLARGIADALGSEGKPSRWFGCLRSAAVAFDKGRDPSEEEDLATRYALEARVSLELLAYRTGTDDQIFAVLRGIDESLKGVSSAVMLLDEDEYLEILAPVEPREGTWWGERIQIDERVRDDVLDSALERWAGTERTIDVVTAWWGRPAIRDRTQYRVPVRFERRMRAAPVALAADVQAPLATAAEMESEDGSWTALLSLAEVRVVKIRFVPKSDAVSPLAPGAWVWFRHHSAQLGGKNPAPPHVVHIDLSASATEAPTDDLPDLAVVTPDGQVIAFHVAGKGQRP